MINKTHMNKIGKQKTPIPLLVGAMILGVHDRELFVAWWSALLLSGTERSPSRQPTRRSGPPWNQFVLAPQTLNVFVSGVETRGLYICLSYDTIQNMVQCKVGCYVFHTLKMTVFALFLYGDVFSLIVSLPKLQTGIYCKGLEPFWIKKDVIFPRAAAAVGVAVEWRQI